MTRRANDWYPTPDWATRELLKRVDIMGAVLEPCVGDGAIATPLAERCLVFTNDLDRKWPASTHWDARDAKAWSRWNIDWVVTNPPFSIAHEILPWAYQSAKVGVAMLLRLSYLEPCEGRGAWLARYPPDQVLVLPRMSFTGDGNTDSVTCAWMIWTKDDAVRGQAIQVVDPVDERQGSLLEATP